MDQKYGTVIFGDWLGVVVRAHISHTKNLGLYSNPV